MERILVLDDDDAILKALEEALAYLNYDVKTIADPKHLFELIETYRPDLLLLDFILSSSNGGAICHQLKSDEQHFHLPIIMMSGYNDVIEQAEKSGANDFIKKPFDLVELDEKISGCLRHKRIAGHMPGSINSANKTVRHLRQAEKL